MNVEGKNLKQIIDSVKIDLFERAAGEILFTDYSNKNGKELRDELVDKFTKKASEIKNASPLLKDNNGLLPCPLCGGKAVPYHRINANTVTCTSCGLKVWQSEIGMGDAEEIWNNRV